VPPAVVTATFTAPALPAGVTAVMVVPLTTTTLVPAFAPNATVAPATKFVPVMVNGVPPPNGPDVAFSEVTVGGGGFTVTTGDVAMATSDPEALDWRLDVVNVFDPSVELAVAELYVTVTVFPLVHPLDVLAVTVMLLPDTPMVGAVVQVEADTATWPAVAFVPAVVGVVHPLGTAI